MVFELLVQVLRKSKRLKYDVFRDCILGIISIMETRDNIEVLISEENNEAKVQ